MIKAIIQVRGYDQKKSGKLRKSIIKFMKKTKLGSSVSCEIVPSDCISCDGTDKQEPYLQIIAAKRKYATNIIDGFRKNSIHELVVINVDNMLCDAEELASEK